MPEPTLVPPTPSVPQGQPITPLPDTAENRDFSKNVADIFDRVSPQKFVKSPAPTEKTPQPASQVVEEPQRREPQEPVQRPPDEAEQKTEEKTQPHKLPSFLEKALVGEPETSKGAPTGQAQPEVEDFPEEMPAVQNSEEQKANYKNWRAKYKALKDEVAALRQKPALDEAVNQKMAYLENNNKAMQEQLNRFGVEHHREFQQRIINPMKAAWGEASRIVKEVGGDPSDLAKALNLTGKAQFEALDEVLGNVPESAKLEINNAVAAYRRLDEARKAALDRRNLPQTVEALKKRDMETQMQYLSQQKENMKSMFDQALARLRDEAKVEVLQKSNDPDAKWWNDQADQIEAVGRGVFIDNTDMDKLAYASLMAPMADAYRKLWLQERTERQKTDRTLKERFGSEPTLSESGGNVRGGQPNSKEDMKKPFSDLFIRTLHQQAGM
jgi:hypothetical protein